MKNLKSVVFWEFRGFTLLELMVSVFIMAVMIAVAAPQLLEAGKKAEYTALLQDEQVIQSALSEYQLMNYSFPTGNTQQQLQTLVSAGLLNSVPVDPCGGQFIINDGNGNSVTVTSTDSLSNS
ncbi:prepilin-type N-terminal cleavage/methylation domain-containing protein [Alicyclobacillus tolerans]|uniref:General secretion pathway protein G n=2 Tax=Alicyclobacillus tolerans TaxID=90970 RepID=A0A1M6XGF9_9BACL|nr:MULTISPECIES: prepilin-type N-terminal cleavage/methylation domain-containing protein [Alicyclobacillus]MDP9728766.1 general secretion pathway protein G [Alicyclobacillus tengchongensis]QRF23224.1 prepilin-type N-terminal cleavage/methylation domain-containing protein [Alicyclobacillus sp. TC]SHL05011.1 general secretion pathway protein G [Alicyclobacillus montanus]